MGLILSEISKQEALEACIALNVVSASDINAFYSQEWKNYISKAEKVQGQQRYFFTLTDGSFVEVEA